MLSIELRRAQFIRTWNSRLRRRSSLYTSGSSTNERDIAPEFLTERERAWNARARDLHRGNLEPWPCGAPEETGTKMAAVAEERTSRSLVGDCVMAA